MINLEWVKDYIDISDQDLEKLAVKITEGKVVSCIDHPDSDHLHLCQVDIGKDELQQIVCGAPNVKKGLKVIVALPGAVLPGDFAIKSSKIRGVESNGMICALYELGLEEKTDETYAKGIEELNENAPVGKDPLVYLGLEDTLYELDIHKHRNNDCYYHLGFAYEIAAILNRKVTLPDLTFKENLPSIIDTLNLTVATKKCPYYSARIVTDIEIGETPDFIKKRLNSVGIRSINNVVDISNYVMLEFGQPLHFFDKDKLGSNILVRDAKDNEEIITLDGKMRILNSDDIVITDGVKPVCIAGVMGGENTEVTPSTKTILIESAIFDPVSIRYTAAKLNLKSEASIRYAKGLNYEYTELALQRACHLLEKYAHAKILTGEKVYDKIDKTPKVVTFKQEEINKMLGINISKEDMEIELGRLDFPFTLNNDTFTVTIPNRRLDVDPNVNDIAEEIGRLYGYQNLVSTLPKVGIRQGKYLGDVKYRKILSKRLRSLGFNEVKTYTLRSLGLNETKTYTLVSKEMASMFNYDGKNCKELPNPMSQDKSVLRTTLIPSLLNIYNYNKARHVEDIMLYEISKVYDIEYNEEIKVAVLMKGRYLSNLVTTDVKVDFYLIKGIFENLLDYLGFKNRYHLEPCKLPDVHPYIGAKIFLDKDMVGIIGKVDPSVNSDDIYILELSLTKLMKSSKPLKYKEASKYPAVSKDIAFIVPKDMTSQEIETVIKKAGGRLLSEIKVFDVYTGEHVSKDEKSIAYNLVFQNNERTLTDEEVMEVFNNIATKVTTSLNVKLRDK